MTVGQSPTSLNVRYRVPGCSRWASRDFRLRDWRGRRAVVGFSLGGGRLRQLPPLRADDAGGSVQLPAGIGLGAALIEDAAEFGHRRHRSMDAATFCLVRKACEAAVLRWCVAAVLRPAPASVLHDAVVDALGKSHDLARGLFLPQCGAAGSPATDPVLQAVLQVTHPRSSPRNTVWRLDLFEAPLEYPRTADPQPGSAVAHPVAQPVLHRRPGRWANRRGPDARSGRGPSGGSAGGVRAGHEGTSSGSAWSSTWTSCNTGQHRKIHAPVTHCNTPSAGQGRRPPRDCPPHPQGDAGITPAQA